MEGQLVSCQTLLLPLSHPGPILSSPSDFFLPFLPTSVPQPSKQTFPGKLCNCHRLIINWDILAANFLNFISVFCEGRCSLDGRAGTRAEAWRSGVHRRLICAFCLRHEPHRVHRAGQN